MAAALTTITKLMLVREIQEDAKGAALRFQGEVDARLSLHDANYATHLRLARRSLERGHPIGVRLDEGRAATELVRADNDVPAQLRADGPDSVRVFFEGHDGVFRLKHDHPESGRIHALLDETIRLKGRVWFIARKLDLALLDVAPASWAAATANMGNRDDNQDAAGEEKIGVSAI